MNAQALAILALAFPNATTVEVIYEQSAGKRYTFLCDQPCKEGDYAVVGPTSGEKYPAVVQIVAVHSSPMLDFNNPNRNYRWVVNIINMAAATEKFQRTADVAKELAAVDLIVNQQAALDRYLSILPQNSLAHIALTEARGRTQGALQKLNLGRNSLPNNTTDIPAAG